MLGWSQVTFTFTLRRSLDMSEPPLCRKEATFTFKKETDNRGWRECIPPSATEESRLYLVVEVWFYEFAVACLCFDFLVQVREGMVATENLTVNVHVDSHPNVLDVRFKVE